MNKKILATRTGAASIYVVIFTTILLGIITVSFLRLMISGSKRTSNNDLSQSAYDSALAGIEDAKIAFLQYRDCLGKGKTPKENGDACEKLLFNINEGIRKSDCDTISRALGRPKKEDKSTFISELNTSDSKDKSKQMAQAYTCVKVIRDLDDYRATLSSTHRTYVIPLRTENTAGVEYLKLGWYSDANKNTNDNSLNYLNYPKFKPRNDNKPFSPPPIIFHLIQTNEFFKLDEFEKSNKTGTNRGTVILYPGDNDGQNEISAEVIRNSNSKAAERQPIKIKCRQDGEFICSAKIMLPKPQRGGIRSEDTAFVRVTLPYGSPETDFSISAYDRNNNIIKFRDVQVMIDSTGRANSLYRRLETRVEFTDPNFPHPEFTVNLNSTDDDSLKKNFWVTKNCWTADNGNIKPCNNNGEL